MESTHCIFRLKTKEQPCNHTHPQINQKLSPLQIQFFVRKSRMQITQKQVKVREKDKPIEYATKPCYRNFSCLKMPSVKIAMYFLHISIRSTDAYYSESRQKILQHTTQNLDGKYYRCNSFHRPWHP
ncbi:hypothetical protein CDL12_00165 [Handroanthus impetiginosus]|uniref:Uncharacterized protein n=1 Tax=Handroanthus impetiginosus TaxID=429701 RepID=A0A2G9IBE6_9LAMI|nr:hypothetical protein CDL12_00165 [Handroanthus impetiginosus]